MQRSSGPDLASPGSILQREGTGRGNCDSKRNGRKGNGNSDVLRHLEGWVEVECLAQGMG